MTSPTAGPLRLVRASVVAAVTVALAALAHVLAGGELPPVVVLLALTAVALAGASALTGRRVGVRTALVALGVGQVALHAAFETVTSLHCATTAAPTGVHAHHVASAVACTTPAHGGSGALVGPSAMLALHTLATLATALVVAGADRALAWTLAWLRRRGVARAVVLPALADLPVAADAASFVRQTWRGIVPRRGPPAWHAPAAP